MKGGVCLQKKIGNVHMFMHIFLLASQINLSCRQDSAEIEF